MLEKQRKGKKGNLTDKCSCSNECSCVLPFLKKREEGKMSAVTYLSNTEPGHFRSFNEKLMNHEAAFLELVQVDFSLSNNGQQ